MRAPGIGLSILLIAVGAVLAWAISVDTDGVNLNTVGVILFVVGIVGLIATLVLTALGGDGETVVERRREI
jgi:hypothetical protein